MIERSQNSEHHIPLEELRKLGREVQRKVGLAKSAGDTKTEEF